MKRLMEAALRESVADARGLGRWRARLPEPLEQRFTAETDPERERQIRFWVGCHLALGWLSLLADLFALPDVAWLSFLLRLCAMTPVSLVAMWLLGRPGPRWVKSIAAIAPPSVVILATLLTFAASPGNSDTLRSAVVLELGVLWINIVVPMRLGDTILYTLVTLLAGDFINIEAAAWHAIPLTHPENIIFSHLLVAFSVIARWLNERQSRRSFLLGLELQIRAEDLTRSNAQLVKISNTDPLTGLANRRSFDLALERACQTAALNRSPLAVMMIDIDHFKQFNDTAGHLEGDRCLAVIARTIGEQVRGEQDLAARFGGEEFVVLMQGTDATRAQEVASRVRTAISTLRLFHPDRTGSGFVSVSIGVAGTENFPVPPSPTELLAAADEALYDAKHAGRDRVMCARRGAIGAPA